MARRTTHRAGRHDERQGKQNGAEHDSTTTDATVDEEVAALQRLATVEKYLTEKSRRLALRPFEPGSEFYADAVSVAWELAVETNAEWPPPTILRIARRCVSRRLKFEHRAINIDETLEYEPVSDFDVSDLFSEHLNPARIVRFCVDFCQWLGTLNGWDYQVATRLRNGHSVADVANALDAPARAIQRTRVDLFRQWESLFCEK